MENPGSIPGWGRSPGEENGSPLQYSCLENFHGQSSYGLQSTGITKSQTHLSNWQFRMVILAIHLLRTARLKKSHSGFFLLGSTEPLCLKHQGRCQIIWSQFILLPKMGVETFYAASEGCPPCHLAVRKHIRSKNISEQTLTKMAPIPFWPHFCSVIREQYLYTYVAVLIVPKMQECILERLNLIARCNNVFSSNSQVRIDRLMNSN